jgi:acetolactate synthase-1/2/3 large subunit
MTKLSDFVLDFLWSKGVRHIFMVPGGGAMHLNDSLARHPHLRFVCNLFEQACAVSSDAYAQFTGNLGVAMVTTGPGGTNAITGVVASYLESTPVLVISGQVKRADLVGNRGVRQIGFQEVNIVEMVKPVTKYAVTVLDPAKIRFHLEAAYWHATHGRKGPVWLDIPLDVQAAQINPDKLEPFIPARPRSNLQKIKKTTDACLSLLKNARRPVLLVGNGARHSKGWAELRKWAEKIKIPIMTTWKALDFIEDKHPLYVGRPGAVGQRAANFAQQTSDLFISIGARLDYGQTAYNHANFAKSAKKVIVDIDGKEIKKLGMKLDVALVSDATIFTKHLLKKTKGLQFPNWSPWLRRCQDWKKRYPIVLNKYYRSSRGINNYVFIQCLGEALKKGDLLVPGSSGACSEITCQALPVPKGLRFINSQGLGAMGFGVAAAVGACIASNNQRTVCVEGDGGFAMSSNELVTAVRLGLNLKIFILNNQGYGSIKTTQKNYFKEKYIACDKKSGLTFPSIKEFAKACSAKYKKIGSHKTLKKQTEDILAKTGTYVCELIMASGQVTQPKVSSRQNEHGQMVTMPMEDLWPFLKSDELQEILKV